MNPEEWAARLERQEQQLIEREKKMTELELLAAKLEGRVKDLENWAMNNGGRAIKQLQHQMREAENRLDYLRQHSNGVREAEGINAIHDILNNAKRR